MLLGWNFTVADDAIFFLLLVISLGIGVYSAFKTRGNTSTLEYLLGSRDLSPMAVFLSLLGGVVSAIAILGNATEMYFYGTQLCMSMMGNILGILIVRNVFLPVLYPLHIVSMNEYIELRFSSPGLRKLAMGCQLVSSFFYMGICLYVPSMTLSSVTGLPTWTSVICMGSIFTFYITIGGARAVVYTDVVQTIMMFGGVLLVTVMCCSQVGGIERVVELAREGGRVEFLNFDPSPFVRHTFWSTNVLGIYVIVSMLALNQSQFQRFCSLKSLDIAKTLCMLFPVGFFLLLVIFYLSGLVAYATYADCDPFTSGKIEKPDMILPYLVTNRLSNYAGLSGFFVAAVYSGVLSTLSSQGSAIACIVWEDLLKNRPYFHHFTDKQATNVIKILSGVTGVAAIALGMLVGHLGTIFMVAYSIMSALKGPLGGLFLAGICTPWVNRKGAAVGFVASFMINVWLIIGKFLRGGGNPTTLPLSVSGCDGNSETFQNATSSAIDLMPVPPSSNIAFPPIGKYNNLYDISYCYSGFIGIILTLVISSFVSVCTGPLPPKTVNQRYLNKTCEWLYVKVWEISCGKKTERGEGEGEDARKQSIELSDKDQKPDRESEPIKPCHENGYQQLSSEGDTTATRKVESTLSYAVEEEMLLKDEREVRMEANLSCQYTTK